jgi:TonB family protein
LSRDVQAQTASCTFDSAAHRESTDLWFALEPVPGSPPLEWQELVRYAIPISQRYLQASSISFRTWPRTTGGTEDAVGRAFDRGIDPTGFSRFEVSAEGRLVGEPRTWSDSPEVASGILQAIRQADSAGDFERVMGQNVGRVISFAISMRTEPRDGAVVFGKVRVPVIILEEAPRMKRAGSQRYPREEMSKGRGGRVDVYYVIDEAGWVVEESIVVLRATSDAFAESAKDMLRRSTFVPARVGGCPMANGVYQTINYTMSR